GRLVELLGRLLGFLGGGLGFVLVEPLLGGFHVLGAFADLLGSFGRGLIDFLLQLVGLGRQTPLLFCQLFVGDGIGLRLIGVPVGLFRDVLFLFRQLVKLLGGVFELGDVVTAFFDL